MPVSIAVIILLGLLFLLLFGIFFLFVYKKFLKQKIQAKKNKNLLERACKRNISAEVNIYIDEETEFNSKCRILEVNDTKFSMKTEKGIDSKGIQKKFDLSFYYNVPEEKMESFFLFEHVISDILENDDGTSTIISAIPKTVTSFEQRIFPRVKADQADILDLGIWLFKKDDCFPTDIGEFGKAAFVQKVEDAKKQITVINISGSGIRIEISSSDLSFKIEDKILLFFSYMQNSVRTLLLGGKITNIQKEEHACFLGIEFQCWYQVHKHMETVPWIFTKRWIGVPPIIDYITNKK